VASSALGGKRNVKIFLLYLMQNIRIRVDFATLNDMVMQTDYVMYLDMAEAFHELLDDALIEVTDDYADDDNIPKDEPRYTVTAKGRIVAEQLHSELLSTILDESLRCALRYLDFRRRGIKTHCSVTQGEDGTADFYCSVEQNGNILFETHMSVDSMLRARQMEENFRTRPEAIYKGMWSLLSGNVNYLFS
jgi:hypothetical protein